MLEADQLARLVGDAERATLTMRDRSGRFWGALRRRGRSIREQPRLVPAQAASAEGFGPDAVRADWAPAEIAHATVTP